jgi:hypothetical protein
LAVARCDDLFAKKADKVILLRLLIDDLLRVSSLAALKVYEKQRLPFSPRPGCDAQQGVARKCGYKIGLGYSHPDAEYRQP